MTSDLIEIFVRAAVSVAAIIALTRLNGLRSFSKMSGFDFAITVACGSIIASSVTSPKESVALGVVSLIALFAIQRLVSSARTRWSWAEAALDNKPLLIMEDGEVLEHNLSAARMTKADLYGKLREANAFDLSKIHAVVFEPTGDVSVLHSTGSRDETVSECVMDGVVR